MKIAKEEIEAIINKNIIFTTKTISPKVSQSITIFH